MKKGRSVAILYMLGFLAVLISRAEVTEAVENLNAHGAPQSAISAITRTGDETVAKY